MRIFFYDCEPFDPVTKPSGDPVPHGAQDIPANGNDISVTVMKTALTDSSPPIVIHAISSHIIHSNGEFGESQDILYDNLDQYAAFNLDVGRP